MTAATDVIARLQILRAETESLRLYALVDGAQFQSRRGTPLDRQPGMYALFDGTPDEPLARAGPWLVDADAASQGLLAELARLELELPAVSWIIATQSAVGLAQLLQLNLNATLPDGRTALLRFWDTRVLVGVVEVLTAEQRYAFFGRIYEWHLLHEGRRVWIGRHRADTE